MKLEIEKCPVCNSDRSKILHSLEKGKLVTCQNCSLIFFTPRPTSEELVDFYNSHSYRELYENSPMAGEVFAKARYEQLHKTISQYASSLFSNHKKQYLDIGCGEGDLLSIAVKDGWEITGTELSAKAVDRANHLLGNKVLLGDVVSLDLPENHYDLITIYHVIEHLIDPIKTLTKIRQLLKPGGLAFIETPNIGSIGARIKGKNWSHIIPPEHITYFQTNSLRYTLKKSGFSEFAVFTDSPSTIVSISKWNQTLKTIATTIYKVAPILRLGATLKAVAFKN
jgi:2-polyprenyl-3-methyl-5-hydroxy-6-metoxy-1,4-benzoquinol methylase